MGKIIEIINSLVIQIECGLTGTGRTAHKSGTIHHIRADITNEEILAFVGVASPVMAGKISSVKLVTKTVYEVWTPEMRKEKLEEKLEFAGQETIATEARAISVSRTTRSIPLADMSDTSQQNSINADFVSKGQVSHRVDAPGTNLLQQNSINADFVSKEQVSLNMIDAGFIQKETAASVEEVNTMANAQSETPAAAPEQHSKTIKVSDITCIGGDFLEWLKQNDYKCTKEELKQWMDWSPHRDITAHEANMTPFKDLDPLIYGPPPIGPGALYP